MSLVYNGYGARIINFGLDISKDEQVCSFEGGFRPRTFLPLIMDLIHPRKTQVDINLDDMRLLNLNYRKIEIISRVKEFTTFRITADFEKFVGDPVENYNVVDDLSLFYNHTIRANNGDRLIKTKQYVIEFNKQFEPIIRMDTVEDDIEVIEFIFYNVKGDKITALLNCRVIPTNDGYVISKINRSCVDLLLY